MALLRWVRTSDASPDRFVPFVVLTAAADAYNVSQTRDLGSTDFMIKPFSAQSIADHLMRIINHPRQFVLCNGYFGPDRRQRSIKSARERRTIQDDEIEIVHSSSTAVQAHLNHKVTYFRLINRLKDKVGAFELQGRRSSTLP